MVGPKSALKKQASFAKKHSRSATDEASVVSPTSCATPVDFRAISVGGDHSATPCRFNTRPPIKRKPILGNQLPGAALIATGPQNGDSAFADRDWKNPASFSNAASDAEWPVPPPRNRATWAEGFSDRLNKEEQRRQSYTNGLVEPPDLAGAGIRSRTLSPSVVRSSDSDDVFRDPPSLGNAMRM